MGRMLRLYSSLLVLQMLFFFSDLRFTVAANPPEISPTPAPESGGIHSPSPTALPPSPDTGAPSPGPSSETPSPEFKSPPAPTPDLVPASSPAPTPSPSDAIKGAFQDETVHSESSSSGGGLKGGQKAGIAVGVIAAGCIVGVVGIIYKKRQDNIRRTQYGYAVRRELL